MSRPLPRRPYLALAILPVAAILVIGSLAGCGGGGAVSETHAADPTQDTRTEPPPQPVAVPTTSYAVTGVAANPEGAAPKSRSKSAKPFNWKAPATKRPGPATSASLDGSRRPSARSRYR